MKILLIVLMIMVAFPVISEEIIGYSAQGREITAEKYGDGDVALILVGGIHGKFEAATVQLMQEFKKHFSTRCLDISLYIIENMNPDSFYVETDLSRSNSTGWLNGERIGNTWHRFNSNYVDLNRNWDTNSWNKDAMYGNNSFKKDAGGTHPMSEPEVEAMANFILNKNEEYNGDVLVINYHNYISMTNKTGMAQPSYTGDFKNPDVDGFANSMAKIYANVSEYNYLEKWTAYEVRGEFLNWAGDNDISAIDIELTNGKDVYFTNSNGETHFNQNIRAVSSIIDNM